MRARTITAALGITLATLGAGCATSDHGAAVLSPCEQAALAIAAVHDYRGTDLERSCFGEEDDPRVAAILAASESAKRVLR